MRECVRRGCPFGHHPPTAQDLEQAALRSLWHWALTPALGASNVRAVAHAWMGWGPSSAPFVGAAVPGGGGGRARGERHLCLENSDCHGVSGAGCRLTPYGQVPYRHLGFGTVRALLRGKAKRERGREIWPRSQVLFRTGVTGRVHPWSNGKNLLARHYQLFHATGNRAIHLLRTHLVLAMYSLEPVHPVGPYARGITHQQF